jgi:TetR/AcrR family transcriptional repressor of nem operon
MDIPHTKAYVNEMKRSTSSVTRSETMAETREKLLRAGAELFAKEGLDGPSLDAICERAGFTRGAFYVHFADRDAFMIAVMEREGLPFLDAILGGREDDAEPPTFEAVMGRFLASVVSGAYPLTRKGGPKPHQLLDACARSKTIRARYVALVADSITRLAKVIEASQDEGTLRSDVKSSDVATLLLAAIIGGQTMLELDAPIDMARTGTAMLTLLTRASKR